MDWLSIEAEYRAKVKPLHQIAREFGTSESTIRRHAKKNGWVRDGTSIKRERVKAHFAGDSSPSDSIEAAAQADIADMSRGLENARLALGLVNEVLAEMNDGWQSQVLRDAKNLKLLAEINRHSVDTIRKIRGLDEIILETPGLDEEDEWILKRGLRVLESKTN